MAAFELCGDEKDMYHGIINVYKEAGYTSHDVVAKLRGICKQKKIGHTGTLDPDAVGVLPVCLGNGTKLCDMLTDRSKEYIAVLQLGLVTDTQDISGRVLEERNVQVTAEQVKEAAYSFLGDRMQIPPMYSALKVNGRKLCELARKGQEIERAARPISIYSIEILKETHPEYTIKVACSKGTYIRTLCHDIGQLLGCGGVMKNLTRTRVGEFKIENTWTLSKLQQLADDQELEAALIPVERMFEGLHSLHINENGYSRLKNGNQLEQGDILPCLGKGMADDLKDGQQFRAYSHKNVFYGIYCYDETRELFRPVKMFLPG